MSPFAAEPATLKPPQLLFLHFQLLPLTDQRSAGSLQLRLFSVGLLGGEFLRLVGEVCDEIMGQINESDGSVEDQQYPAHEAESKQNVKRGIQSDLRIINIVNSQPDIANEDQCNPYGCDDEGEEERPQDTTRKGFALVRFVEEHSERIEEGHQDENYGIEDVVDQVVGTLGITSIDSLVQRKQQHLPPSQSLRQDDQYFGQDLVAETSFLGWVDTSVRWQ